MAASKNAIYLTKPKRIEGRLLPAGTVLGEMKDGRPRPTADGVTRGHLEAALQFRQAAVGDPADLGKAAKGKPDPGAAGTPATPPTPPAKPGP